MVAWLGVPPVRGHYHEVFSVSIQTPLKIILCKCHATKMSSVLSLGPLMLFLLYLLRKNGLVYIMEVKLFSWECYSVIIFTFYISGNYLTGVTCM